MTPELELRATEPGRGRDARWPGAIPARGLKDVVIRLKREMREDRVWSVSAGVAFFGVLALFPTLIAIVSSYGLFADPADVQRQLGALAAVLPGPAQQVLGARLHELVSASTGELSFGLVLSILVALWSASSGTSALIEAVNVAYDETERRGFFARRALALAMAVGLVSFGIVALFVITALPLVFERVGFGDEGRTVITLLRWPVLALLAMLGLSVLYRFAPNRSRAKWRWLSVGSVVATLMWIAASLLLSLWVSSFGDVGATYGTLAGVILLMLWMLVSTLSILLGAEINSELEAQTAVDSTTGPAKPMGQRGAHKADTLGESYG